MGMIEDIFGGLTGDAIKAIKERKKRLQEAEDKATGNTEKEAAAKREKSRMKAQERINKRK